MSTYLIVKWMHVLSSVVLVGTGFGTAFYLFFANRSGEVAAQAVVTRLVVRADWWFTTPAILLQPVTGLWLMHLMGLPLNTPWILWAFALYCFSGLFWIPVVWLQLRMNAMAESAHASGQELPVLYWTYARWWERLGYPAFLAMLIIFYLMVAKPDL